MKKATLFVDYSFRVKCPICGHELDLADGDYDSDSEFSKPIFNNKWDDLKGIVTNCSNCDQEFIIDDVDVF